MTLAVTTTQKNLFDRIFVTLPVTLQLIEICGIALAVTIQYDMKAVLSAVIIVYDIVDTLPTGDIW